MKRKTKIILSVLILALAALEVFLITKLLQKKNSALS